MPTTLPVHTIDHVEIVSNDTEITGRFFEACFAWRVRTGPGGTSLETADGAPIARLRDVKGDEAPRLTQWITVPDIEQAVRDVAAHGGTIVAPIGDASGGRRAAFQAPGGNVFGLWQPA